MIKITVDEKIDIKDVANKIHDNHFVKTIRFCGIVVWRKTCINLVNVKEKETLAPGFKSQKD